MNCKQQPRDLACCCSNKAFAFCSCRIRVVSVSIRGIRATLLQLQLQVPLPWPFDSSPGLLQRSITACFPRDVEHHHRVLTGRRCRPHHGDQVSPIKRLRPSVARSRVAPPSRPPSAGKMLSPKRHAAPYRSAGSPALELT